MGKYCTDCAKEIEKQSKEEAMFAFAEIVRCKECLGKSTEGNDFMNPNPPAGTQ